MTLQSKQKNSRELRSDQSPWYTGHGYILLGDKTFFKKTKKSLLQNFDLCPVSGGIAPSRVTNAKCMCNKIIRAFGQLQEYELRCFLGFLIPELKRNINRECKSAGAGLITDHEFYLFQVRI